MRSDYRSQLLYYACQAVVLAIALTALLGLSQRDLSVPFVVEGDALHHLLSAKIMMESGWWWHADRLSAPFTLDMRAFPVGGSLDYLLLRLFTLVTSEPGLALNLCWLFTFFLTAAVATACFNFLAVSPLVSTVMGLLYALTPRAFYNSVSAFPLTTYVLPPVLVTATLILSGRWPGLSRRRRLILLSACFLSGLNYTYHSFFSAFLLCLAGVLGALSLRRANLLKAGSLAAGLVVGAAVLHVAPALWAWHGDPATRNMIDHLKDTREADVYGLKLRHLVTPVEDHFLPPLRRVEEKIQAVGWPDENENASARLGFIGTAGLAVLLLALLVPGAEWLAADIAIIRSLASLNLALILLGVVGGLGSLWSVFISPDIRAYNRVSSYIAFFCLAAVGVLLTKVIGNGITGSFRLSLANCTWMGLVLLFGILDQNATKHLNVRYEADAEKYRSVKEFVSLIESRFKPGSAIYELPYADYPETSPVHQMTINDPILAYVHSHHLRWSWPTLAVEAAAWNRGVSSLPPEEMINWLCRAGFAGIWVDRNGFPDRSLETALGVFLVEQPIVSGNGRYAVFNISGQTELLLNGKNTAERDAIAQEAKQGWVYRWGTPVVFDDKHPTTIWSLRSGWGPQEPGYRWTYGHEAWLGFHVEETSEDKVLSIKVFQFLPYKRMPVSVKVDGKEVGTWNAVGREEFSLRIPAAVLSRKTLFTVSLQMPEANTPRYFGTANDERVLGLAVREVRIGN